MFRKTFSILSNIIFALAITLGVYILIDTYLARRALPPGVCPIDNNRTLIYITIGLTVVSFAMSFFDNIKNQDNKSNNNNITNLDETTHENNRDENK